MFLSTKKFFMIIKFELIKKIDFQDNHRNTFVSLLKKQGKVKGDLSKKLDRCKQVCFAYVDDNPVAIGAIKRKTESDFKRDKADLPLLSKEFEWELGYLYTMEGYEGKGIASFIVRNLIENNDIENLMATTEISNNPWMVKILKKNGFKHYGKPWKSSIHNNFLGLFLKFK